MSPQPCWIRLTSRMSLLALLAALSAVTWSAPAQARTPGGIIGVGYYGHHGPPPWVDAACRFTAVHKPCVCALPAVAPLNETLGCSNTSQAWADLDAKNTCTRLCTHPANNPSGDGGTVARPGGSADGEVLFRGSGAVRRLQTGGYLGFVPYSEAPLGYGLDVAWVASAVVEATTVPWVFLEDLGPAIQWDDSKGSAAFVQAYSSERGAPQPIGTCRHALQVSCPLTDVKLGDRLQVCSGQSEEDAKRIAQTSCAPLRYEALSRSWSPWALYGAPSEQPHRAPSATVVAVGPGQFLGYVPSSLQVVGFHEDWTRLSEALLERTDGTTVWLAGPAEFYAPKAE
ncbi:hypothetical protein K8640_30695 [Myxococcus sp. XM-1-1-1]|uniref:hypothetical protein n=1 Tax=Myxococcus sp. XM-1-1-1 TaxID=2874602 RepID=UPI001CBBA599|nr:hypothetical protein [Myxococcus sp. XM-1-1-1]MBZ4412603.1 hypothetical protein [Myxococcus sp. XM-1-1-1]BDT32575.1 hypothetical protein MFMH1_22440 [Myxococcus sp. MH1]